MKGHMYIPVKWTRRKNNTWFSDNLSVSLTQSYRIQYHKGAYKDYLYTVDTLEVGNGVDTPAEMYNHRGYGKTLKKAQELANEIEYICQFQIRQEALRKINDLDWERVNR
jgi:hypothetical protein